MTRRGSVEHAKPLSPSNADVRSEYCSWTASGVVLIKEGYNAWTDGDARLMAVSVLGGVLLQEDNMGAVPLELNAL